MSAYYARMRRSSGSALPLPASARRRASADECDEAKTTLNVPSERGQPSSASHARRTPEIQRGALHLAGIALALRHRDQQIAAARQREADRGVPRAVGHLEIIAARASGHVGDRAPPCPPRAAQTAGSSDRDRRRGRPRRHRRRRCRNCRSRSSAARRVRPRRRTAAASQRNARPAGQPSRGNGQAISCQCRVRDRSPARAHADKPPTPDKRAERQRRRPAMASQRRIGFVSLFMADRRRRARARSAPGYASRYWRDRRCRCSRGRRSRHCWSGSRPCSGPCRRR